jgi:hypothetical protein
MEISKDGLGGACDFFPRIAPSNKSRCPTGQRLLFLSVTPEFHRPCRVAKSKVPRRRLRVVEHEQIDGGNVK